MKEHIICSALHIKNEKQYVHQPKNIDWGFVVCGRRHHNCFATLFMIDSNVNKNTITQGFLTNTDRFVDRTEAFQIAKWAGQIITPNDQFEECILTSEDIY